MRNEKHDLLDMIIIVICAVICGCESWDSIALYGREKETWLRKFLKLENSIPSHDAFRSLFIKLDPDELSRCFLSWVESVREHITGEIVSIDGKTVRRSHDKARGKQAIHLVSA